MRIGGANLFSNTSGLRWRISGLCKVIMNLMLCIDSYRNLGFLHAADACTRPRLGFAYRVK